ISPCFTVMLRSSKTICYSRPNSYKSILSWRFFGKNPIEMKDWSMTEDQIFSYIQKALNFIGNDGEPDVEHRYMLRKMLRDQVTIEGRSSVIWFAVEILAARKVCSIWKASFPFEELPVK